MTPDMKLPSCAVGTWAWGDGANGSKMVFGGKRDTETLKASFKIALQKELLLWDTAEVYGMGSSERLLGECIREAGDMGSRVLISTKHMPKKKYSPGEVRSALFQSLERIGVNKADIYWLHLPNNAEQNLNECAELVNEGRIGLIGLSNFNLDEMIAADKQLGEKGLRVGAVQNHFSLIRRDPEQLRILDWCHKNDVPYFSYMVLEQGALTGKYDDEHPFKGISMRSLQYNKGVLKMLRPLIDCLRELGIKYNAEPSQIAVSWAISKGTVPIVGITKPRQAEELAMAKGIVLEASEISRLEALSDASGVVSKGIWEPKLPM
ncbi:MAG: aldo/keto reductase [Huintestinicola sp.]|uniref:aldo/keto reductase n=1 Tax=Huintestinicola sp. TaxID=2981661 RepID=UPI003EFF6D32